MGCLRPRGGPIAVGLVVAQRDGGRAVKRERVNRTRVRLFDGPAKLHLAGDGVGGELLLQRVKRLGQHTIRPTGNKLCYFELRDYRKGIRCMARNSNERYC